jgi:hypothetical protein
LREEGDGRGDEKMKVHGVNKYGIFDNSVELLENDLFAVEIEDVDPELTEKIVKRGLELPFAVERIDEEKGLVYAKKFSHAIPGHAVIKHIKD